MKILEGVYLVGSGAVGLSHDFDCHVYLIDGLSELALIDAGGGLGVKRIIDNVRTAGFAPELIRYVFITHAHADHAGGAADLEKFLGCKVLSAHEEALVIGSGDEVQLGLEIAKASGGYTPDYRFHPCKVLEVADGETIKVGRLVVKSIIVPGHTAASTCYLVSIDGRNCLFSGDTVFIHGLIGLLNCPGCSLEAYRRSIGKLANLSVDALLPGHLLFTVTGGQNHINQAIDRFARAQMPASIAAIC